MGVLYRQRGVQKRGRLRRQKVEEKRGKNVRETKKSINRMTYIMIFVKVATNGVPQC